MFKNDVKRLRKKTSKTVKIPSPPKNYIQSHNPTCAFIEKIIPEEEWSAGMRYYSHLSKGLADILLGLKITVKIIQSGHNFRASYENRQITFNLTVLGKNWFEQGHSEEIIELILQELAYEFESNHLSENYTKGVYKLAARAISQTLLSTADFTP